MLRIVFITLITIGGVIAYAILAPILITYTCATISVRVGTKIATITGERVAIPATLAPRFITYIIPIIIRSVYAFTVLAYLNAIITDYLTIIRGERIILTYLTTTLTTIDEFIIIIIWHYLTPLGVIVALSYHTLDLFSSLV
jgi:hypothetical protein